MSEMMMLAWGRGREQWIVEGDSLPAPQPGDSYYETPAEAQRFKKRTPPWEKISLDREQVADLTYEEFCRIKNYKTSPSEYAYWRNTRGKWVG